MGLYFLKPVVWNGQGYARPAGDKFSSGYPAEHGFGHEEWNNSPRLEFIDRGVRYRVFHIQGLGNQPLQDFAGRIMVFMIASYAGHQYLVGVAGKVAAVAESERRALVNRLRLHSLWKEAWALPSVRRAHRNDERHFMRHWNEEIYWLPSWKCPADHFLWLPEPVVLDPQALTGKRRLVGMYGTYHEVGRHLAARILDLVSTNRDAAIVENLRVLCSDGNRDVAEDIARIETEVRNPTTRKALIDARLGQGKFRAELDRIWGGRCAILGSAVREALRASHIKPWKECNNTERLDPQNGLLLAAHLDALFDGGLIGFADDGEMLISPMISTSERRLLGLGGALRMPPTAQQREYLRFHRQRMLR